jgi:hypothetical protein
MIFFLGINYFFTCSSNNSFQKTFIQSNETLFKSVIILVLFSNKLIDFLIVYNLAEEYASSKDYDKALK